MFLFNNGKILNLTVTQTGESDEDTFYRKLQESGEMSTGLLPFGCRSIRRNNGRSTVVVEYPPQIMTARFQLVCGPTISRLAVPILLPWQIYVFKGATIGTDVSVQMFWRNSRLRSLGDEVLNVVMPNMEPAGARHAPCLGSMDARLPSDMMEKIQVITSHLLTAPLNDDLDSKIQRMLPEELRQTLPTCQIGETVIPAGERRPGLAADYILRLHAWNNGGVGARGGLIAWPTAGPLLEYL